MDELLHHWQISLISQGRVRVCADTTLTLTHTLRHTHWHICMHADKGVCVARSCAHAFYQSNLIGKSMLWLTNRALMQSRGLSSPLPPPVSIFTYPTLLCPSPPPLPSFFSCFLFCEKQQNNICTGVCRQAGETRPTDSATVQANTHKLHASPTTAVLTERCHWTPEWRNTKQEDPRERAHLMFMQTKGLNGGWLTTLQQRSWITRCMRCVSAQANVCMSATEKRNKWEHDPWN